MPCLQMSGLCKPADNRQMLCKMNYVWSCSERLAAQVCYAAATASLAAASGAAAADAGAGSGAVKQLLIASEVWPDGPLPLVPGFWQG